MQAPTSATPSTVRFGTTTRARRHQGVQGGVRQHTPIHELTGDVARALAAAPAVVVLGTADHRGLQVRGAPRPRAAPDVITITIIIIFGGEIMCGRGKCPAV